MCVYSMCVCVHVCACIETYLVVLVGGVILEEDDALAVETPVVPLPLWGERSGVRGQLGVKEQSCTPEKDREKNKLEKRKGKKEERKEDNRRRHCG